MPEDPIVVGLTRGEAELALFLAKQPKSVGSKESNLLLLKLKTTLGTQLSPAVDSDKIKSKVEEQQEVDRAQVGRKVLEILQGREPICANCNDFMIPDPNHHSEMICAQCGCTDIEEEQIGTEPIMIWPWPVVPERYKYGQGGDEDWVAFIPEYLKENAAFLPIDRERFGCCRVNQVDVEGGILWIGQHA